MPKAPKSSDSSDSLAMHICIITRVVSNYNYKQNIFNTKLIHI